ncbi:MAG: hypothetical protein RLZZ592_1699 [Pseudomonadota bacterium]
MRDLGRLNPAGRAMGKSTWAQRWHARVSGRPLRQQLGWLISLCTGVTLLLSVLATMLVGWYFALRHAEAETAELTATIAQLIAESLAAQDADAVSRELSVAESQPRVSGIWVFAAGQTTPLASWGHEPVPALWSREGELLSGRLVRSVPVVDHLRERVGSVTVQLDQHDLLASLLAQSGAMVIVAMLAWLMLRRFALPLARRISQPLDELAAAATAIAEGRTEQVQLPPPGHDEIGRTVAAFQSMLHQIRSRDCTVEQALALMNQLVEERTAEARRAEAASEAKTRFLTVMSHELRTPLHGILGLSDLLLEATGPDDLPDEAREQLLLLRESAETLRQVISDVFDYARTESADPQLAQAPLEPRVLIGQALAARQDEAQARGLALSLQIEPAVPAWLQGDAARLVQIVDNLVGNAIKFTERGHIAVRLDSTPAEAAERGGRHELHLSVQDTGIGIPLAQQQRIFEAFSQGADPATRRHGGTGLGLAICARLARLMGGSITVDSAPGHGSTFHVRLNLCACEAPAPGSAREPEPTSGRDLDHAALLERVGGDLALLGELIGMLVEDSLPRLDRLEAVLRQGDAAQAERLASELAGEAASCSAEAVERLARRVGSLAREQRLDEALRLMEPLRLGVARLAQFAATTG